MLSIEKIVTRKSLSNNLLEYAEKHWKEGCFNDVTIKLEDETIEANRMVLASRSLYFEKMFKTEMKEKYQPTVELQDINGTAVKHLIEFIYIRSIDINSENVLDLLTTADYLQMDEAKQFCFEYLQSVITSDTSFFVLSVANLYQNEQLKVEALECISKDLGDVEFDNNLSKNDFITCISKMKESQAKESAIYQCILSWTKFDENARTKEFPEFLFLLDFAKLSFSFIQDTILMEDLVMEENACLKFVTKKLKNASKKELIKQAGATKVISVGGSKNPNAVVEVYGCIDEPLINYPDVPFETKYPGCEQLRLAGKLDDQFFVAGYHAHIHQSPENWKLKLNDTPPIWDSATASNFIHFDPMVNEGKWVDVTSSSVIRFYLPHTNQFINGPNLKPTRQKFSYTSYKGTLYVLGGTDMGFYGKALSSVQRLTTTGLLQKQTWQEIEHMQKSRTNFAAVTCRNMLYAVGGQSATNKTMKSVEKYDSSTMEWSYVSSMIFERQRHAACVVDGKIIVVGGVDAHGDAIHEIECYDPAQDMWSIVGQIEKELYDHLLVAV